VVYAFGFDLDIGLPFAGLTNVDGTLFGTTLNPAAYSVKRI
jgi:hypothetical protein